MSPTLHAVLMSSRKMHSPSYPLVSGWEPFHPADSEPAVPEAVSSLKKDERSNAQIVATADARRSRHKVGSKFCLFADWKRMAPTTQLIFEFEVLHTNLVKYIIHIDCRFSRRFHEEQTILLSISLCFLQHWSAITLQTNNNITSSDSAIASKKMPQEKKHLCLHVLKLW